MSRLNIPPLIEQMRENMLDKSNNEHIRYNYMVSLQAVRDYCDMALREYEKGQKRK